MGRPLGIEKAIVRIGSKIFLRGSLREQHRSRLETFKELYFNQSKNYDIRNYKNKTDRVSMAQGTKWLPRITKSSIEIKMGENLLQRLRQQFWGVRGNQGKRKGREIANDTTFQTLQFCDLIFCSQVIIKRLNKNTCLNTSNYDLLQKREKEAFLRKLFERCLNNFVVDFC